MPHKAKPPKEQFRRVIRTATESIGLEMSSFNGKGGGEEEIN
jgi:hypothetical protein